MGTTYEPPKSLKEEIDANFEPYVAPKNKEEREKMEA